MGSLPALLFPVGSVELVIVVLFVEGERAKASKAPPPESNLPTLTALTTRKASAMFPALRERRTACDAGSESESVGEEVDTSRGRWLSVNAL